MPTLRDTNLDWALNHAERVGDTTVLPAPFEFQAIRHDWPRLRAELLSQDVNSWSVRAHRALLAPKGRYGFRWITQLDPLDFLIYASLVVGIASDVERRRIPVSERVVFSYRYKRDVGGLMFDPSVGFPQFQEETQRILAQDAYTYVATTDIADFYHRIYLHRLKGAMDATTQNNAYVDAIERLLMEWNGRQTFGIPVGNAPSRVLAECLLSSIDDALLARRVRFVRFNDDFRIFAKTHAEAYRHLAFLAEQLNSYGLTLNQHKTEVLAPGAFRLRFLRTMKERAVGRLAAEFRELLERIGVLDPYAILKLDDLDEESKRQLDRMNLDDMLVAELKKSEPDVAMLTFILRRKAQLRDDAIIDTVLDNLDRVYHVLPEVVTYLKQMSGLSEQRRTDIGRKLLMALRGSTLSELPYHRVWVLQLFAGSTEWKNEREVEGLLSRNPDAPSHRKIVLAMGRARRRHWFDMQWTRIADYQPWIRRAVIAGMSCLPSDPRRHWYGSMAPRMDSLEKAVASWAQTNPF